MSDIVLIAAKFRQDKSMESKEITDSKENVYVTLDPDELRTDFDTGVTKVTLEYFDGKPEDNNSLCEIRIEMSDEFIADTYRLREEISKDVKIKASFDLAARIYQEKRGAPTKFDAVIGVKTNSPLRYIPKIDMQPISHR